MNAAPGAGDLARQLLDLVTVDDPRISPDGTEVAWIETRIDAGHDRTEPRLKLSACDDSAGERVLVEGHLVRRPRWSPNGQELAMIVGDAPGGGTRIASVDRSGGTLRWWGEPGGDIVDFAWAPDGSGVALVILAPTDDSLPAGPAGVVRTRRLRWKQDGRGFVGDRWTQLSWLAREGDAPARPWLHGPYDVAAPAWSPDGRTLALWASDEADAPDDASRRRDLWLIAADDVGRRSARRIASFADVRLSELAWSPDGSRIAVAAHDRIEVGHYAAQRVGLVDVTSGDVTWLSSDEDGTVGNAAYTDVGGYGGSTGPRWLPSDGSIVAPISVSSTVRLSRFVAGARPLALTPDDRVAAAFSVDRAGRRAAVLSWDRHGPGEIEIVDLTAPGVEPLRVTRAGEPWRATKPAVPPERIPVPAEPAADLPAVDAWIVMPPGSDRRADSVPLILYCGGGPGGMRSDTYFFEFQMLAQAGYAVLFLNARGCQGYGDPFCTAILGDWGGADWDDERRALDAALAHVPALDRSRIGIAGGSYGGYQVNWATAHDDRFVAAVTDRSVSNRVSAFGTSDMGFQRTFEYDGATPWSDVDAYLHVSPLVHVGRVTTPTLVVHSALDHRCPIEQGEQWFFALRARGVPAELLRFPNESHGLSRGGRPWHRVARLEAYVEWFDRWMGARAGTAP